MPVIRTSDHAGGVRVLALDRPPANAIDELLLTELAVALNEAQADPAVRALAVTGTGRFFSGGFDLAAPRRDAAAARQMQRLYRDVHAELLGFPKPTLAAVNGHAIAGGFVLALACDYRLGLDADYRIGLNEIAVGAGFPRTAVEIVRLRLPHARASELMLGAALYPASQGVRLGLVDELLAPDAFEATVQRRAARLGAFPRAAYVDAKLALVSEALERIARESDADGERTDAVWRDPESRAARRAQREKLGIANG
ncbi:MAG TPA: enoyl-CoA hydratase/isomerase family protein [Candidatus Limnocylindria bacterium]|nr:enoyl-CoA hydratase/isomerase family protein [Candidatus Limnocylindria bacterium]